MTLLASCKPPLISSFIFCKVKKCFLFSLLMAGMEFVLTMSFGVSGAFYIVYPQLFGIFLFWMKIQEFFSLGKGKKANQRKVELDVTKYKELQVLEKVVNSILRGRILHVSLVLIPAGQVLCGVAFLTLFSAANPFQLALFLVIYLDTALLNGIILTSSAAILLRTKDWIEAMKARNDARSRKSYFRRVQQSLKPLRMEFRNNFVDRLTLLIMQEFCIVQTASVLIMMRGFEMH